MKLTPALREYVKQLNGNRVIYPISETGAYVFNTPNDLHNQRLMRRAKKWSKT